MKLEAVQVCVNYADFLAESLPLNKQHFNKLVIVTSEDDLETQRLCEYHHVMCVTADFGPDGEFHKAVGINRGLQELAMDGWVAHIDADIVLPPQTKSILETLHLRNTSIYGIDRFKMHGYKAWRKQTKKPDLVHEAGTYIHTQKFPIATRFMTAQYGGYLPIGFFQMWNPLASGVGEYPVNNTSAGRTDMLFAGQWERRDRCLLPEIVCFHLESEDAPQGANWNGRTTKPFRRQTPCSWCRHRWHHHKHRHHHHHPHPYE